MPLDERSQQAQKKVRVFSQWSLINLKKSQEEYDDEQDEDQKIARIEVLMEELGKLMESIGNSRTQSSNRNNLRKPQSPNYSNSNSSQNLKVNQFLAQRTASFGNRKK